LARKLKITTDILITGWGWLSSAALEELLDAVTGWKKQGMVFHVGGDKMCSKYNKCDRCPAFKIKTSVKVGGQAISHRTIPRFCKVVGVALGDTDEKVEADEAIEYEIDQRKKRARVGVTRINAGVKLTG